MAKATDLLEMHWQCIHLTRQEYESGELDIIRGAFRAAYLSSNGPAGMALFGQWDVDGLHYLIYATPVTERYFRAILNAYSAKQENPPRKVRSLDYICGDENGGDVLVC